MKCVICGQPIEEGRRQGQPPLLAKYCLKCRTERRRRARVKYTWLPEHDAYLKAHYFGGLNRRFQVLTPDDSHDWCAALVHQAAGRTVRPDDEDGPAILDTGGDGSSREPGWPRVISNNRKAIASPRELNRE